MGLSRGIKQNERRRIKKLGRITLEKRELRVNRSEWREG